MDTGSGERIQMNSRVMMVCYSVIGRRAHTKRVYQRYKHGGFRYSHAPPFGGEPILGDSHVETVGPRDESCEGSGTAAR